MQFRIPASFLFRIPSIGYFELISLDSGSLALILVLIALYYGFLEFDFVLNNSRVRIPSIGSCTYIFRFRIPTALDRVLTTLDSGFLALDFVLASFRFWISTALCTYRVLIALDSGFPALDATG